MTSRLLIFVLTICFISCEINTCPNGFIPIGNDNSCYHFSNATGNWTYGVHYCGNLNSQLVSIESVEENFAINLHLYYTYGLKKVAFWTSGTDLNWVNNYIWISNGKQVRYPFWCNGKKLDNYKGLSCIEIMHFENGNTCWIDSHCSQSVVYTTAVPLRFLCEYQIKSESSLAIKEK